MSWFEVVTSFELRTVVGVHVQLYDMWICVSGEDSNFSEKEALVSYPVYIGLLNVSYCIGGRLMVMGSHWRHFYLSNGTKGRK